jgi:Rrf2 family transcriptional regulator, iron-sulfur cluster assembly transcription factor
MSLLPRKGLLAIAAVIDVALNARERPVSARQLAARHNLPPRHLEPVLQALVHEGIFKGLRGPRGGYELARERRRISVADILRAAGTVEDNELSHGSRILDEVVQPTLAEAERAFTAALARLSLDEMARSAEPLRERGD